MLTILIALLGVLYLLVRAFPYVAYNQALKYGMNNRFLKVEKLSDVMKETGDYSFVKMAGLYGEDKSYWRTFHFRHFDIPMPVHHPVYLYFPQIVRKDKIQNSEFGVKITDYRQNEVFSFKVNEAINFSWDLDKTKLFSLMIFKNHIVAHKPDEIWRDLFMKNLRIPEFEWSHFVSIMKTWLAIPEEELVYNLFLLVQRQKFLPNDVKEVKYFSPKNMGAIEIIDNETKEGRIQNYRQEHWLFMVDGKIYPFEIRARLDSIEAEALRQKYLKEIEFHYTNESSSTELYNKFKALPYEKKIDQEGMVYLFTAWSHVPERKQFLREMIQFLERGKKNELNITPLYEFARVLYGTNFSTDEELIDETASEKLKRKMKEELKQELKNVQVQGPTTDGKFESEEAKVKYFLQKAKDSGDNLDKKEKVINVD